MTHGPRRGSTGFSGTVTRPVDSESGIAPGFYLVLILRASKGGQQMDQRAPLPMARTVLITTLVLALASAGHLGGGGILPPLIVLIGLGVGVLGPVAWAVRRRLTLGRLLMLLGATQLVLHEAFTRLAAGPACAPVTDHHGPHHGVGAVPACPGGAGLETVHHMASSQGAAMLIGHLLAVLATAVVLTRVETAVWLALEWLRPLLCPACPTRLLPVSPQLGAPPAERPVLGWRGLRRDWVRGPPTGGVPRMDSRV